MLSRAWALPPLTVQDGCPHAHHHVASSSPKKGNKSAHAFLTRIWTHGRYVSCSTGMALAPGALGGEVSLLVAPGAILPGV